MRKYTNSNIATEWEEAEFKGPHLRYFRIAFLLGLTISLLIITVAAGIASLF